MLLTQLVIVACVQTIPAALVLTPTRIGRFAK